MAKEKDQDLASEHRSLLVEEYGSDDDDDDADNDEADSRLPLSASNAPATALNNDGTAKKSSSKGKEASRVRKLSSCGSFASDFSDKDPLNVTLEEDDSAFLVLYDENEKLRAEVSRLKVQIAVLQGSLAKQQQQQQMTDLPRQQVQSDEQRSSSSANSEHSILFDLPSSLRQAAAKFARFRRTTSVKSHQSHPTDDDDATTIGPEHDIEMYETSKGLHNRNHHGSSPPKRQVPPPSSLSLSNVQNGFDDDDEQQQQQLAMELEGLVQKSSSDAQNQHGTTGIDEIDANEGDEPESFCSAIQERAGWLIGLLVLQSMSSFIIAKNESLLKKHGVIVQFLTMLVGAGGNAGNQASVRVIRGLAIGTVHDGNTRQFLRDELLMGTSLSCLLGLAGFIRAIVFSVPMVETVAITSSLFMIVFMSVAIGATLPLVMKMVHIDPAHSSTTIQVIMDILGVTVTVGMCQLILDSEFQYWLQSMFSQSSV
eukprot:CAMPEP_0119561736 /NCGR_PEP_ID=MMETSP1352-20130426/18485_1 /TAXON_ID=265584 /ORGANISM="Stauroneis constricta, Strain CCMP1120" /LENGTH=482 /DNA_ID=CAMNT_0007610009 /DNA_START=31 /DNA_END=1479 /DNA_ORIENTATION=+